MNQPIPTHPTEAGNMQSIIPPSEFKVLWTFSSALLIIMELLLYVQIVHYAYTSMLLFSCRFNSGSLNL